MKTKRFLSILLALCLTVGMAVAAGVSVHAVEPLGYVAMSVDADVLGTDAGVLYGPALVPFYAGENYAAVTDRFLGSANYQAMGTLALGFDLKGVKLPRDFTLAIPDALLDAEDPWLDDSFSEWLDPMMGGGSGHTHAGEFLAANDFTPSMSGWMITVNHEFLSVGVSDAEPEDGDVARWQFTLCWGSDIGTDWWTYPDPGFIYPDDMGVLTTAVAKVNSAANKAQLLADAAVLAAYNDGMDILSDLLAEQADINSAAAALDSAVAAANAAIALAEAKTAKLAAIDAVTAGLNEADYTPESWAALQDALTAARTAVNTAGTVTAVNAVVVPTASVLEEISTLQKWQAKLPGWMSGVIQWPAWIQWIIMIVFFGWIWWLF